MSAPKPSRWIKVFHDFAADVRISSKEVVSPDERGVPLMLWESQRRFLNEVGAGLDAGIKVFNCLKGRQEGITTISLLIDTFWLAIHHNLTGALVTDTEKNRDVNRSIIEHYVASFEEGYFGEGFGIVKANRQFLEFSNGSRLDLLVAGTKKKSTAWGEGVGYTLIHETEIGSYGDEDGVKSFEESFAQNHPNRLMIREGTAKGFNHWRDIWMSGLEDTYTQRSFFCGWWTGDMNRIERSDPRFLQFGKGAPSGDERERVVAVAERYGWKITPEQLAWVRWKETQEGGTQILAQNQPWLPEDAFITSGYSFFQSRVVGKDIKKILDDPDQYAYEAYKYEMGASFFDMKLVPIEDEREQGQIELRVWDEPVPTARYVIGMDTAWGRNQHSDRNVCSVWRCYADKLVQVAEFATAGMEVNRAAWVLAHLAGVYRDCVVNIEVNGPGGNIMTEWAHVRGQFASDMFAERVRSLDWEDALGNARWYLYHRPDSMGAGYAYNTMTSQKIGEQVMHAMRGYYVTGALEIRSKRLLQEMAIVVVDEAGHIGALESKNLDSKDDRVFAAAFAIKAWQDWVKLAMLAEGLTWQLVTDRDSGNATPASIVANRLVSSFFKTSAEIQAMEPSKPKYLVDRGLA